METKEMTEGNSEKPKAEQSGSKSEDQKKATAYWKLFLARMFLGMVIYILSFGPMYWNWYQSMYLGGNDFFVRLYAPLLRMSEFDPFGRWLQKYVEWWIL